MQDIYPWLQPLWGKWQALSEAERISGAMLCVASEGTGIEKLAQLLVNTLVCHNSTTEPCGFCHSCELAKAKHHPDIHWIVPEKEGKAITVDQIRLCNQWALESSQLGGKRVIVISPAEAMNESASNALLKTLESPARDCVFLLLSRNKSQLLPTITSRCQTWVVATPELQDTYHWLTLQTESTCNYVGIRLCNGAPLKALEFFEQGTYEQFLQLESALTNLLESGGLDYNQVWLAVKNDPLRSFTWLSVLMADIQKAHFHINELGMCEQSRRLAEIVSYSAANNAMISMNKMKHQLEQFTGLNAELLLTNWLIELQEDICL